MLGYSSQAAERRLPAPLHDQQRVNTRHTCRANSETAHQREKLRLSPVRAFCSCANIIIAGCIINQLQRPCVCHVLRVELIKGAVQRQTSCQLESSQKDFLCCAIHANEFAAPTCDAACRREKPLNSVAAELAHPIYAAQNRTGEQDAAVCTVRESSEAQS